MTGLPPEVGGGGGGKSRRAGGGCINEAAVVQTDRGSVFVKWKHGAPAGFFDAEADGLSRLAATDTVLVPEVIAVRDGPPGPGAIVMQLLDEGPKSPGAMADAGRRLAELHARRGAAPGLERDNYIGSLPQENGPTSQGSWLSFFFEKRLVAPASGLPETTRRLIDSFPVDKLLDEPRGGCALLHGDLWGGNLLCTRGGEGWLVDPAVYAGHPEVDLAMTRLFGGFSEAFYGAYQEVAGRFDSGLSDRLEVLNLYPLLVHARLFGGGYLSQVDQVLRRYGR